MAMTLKKIQELERDVENCLALTGTAGFTEAKRKLEAARHEWSEQEERPDWEKCDGKLPEDAVTVRDKKLTTSASNHVYIDQSQKTGLFYVSVNEDIVNATWRYELAGKLFDDLVKKYNA